MDATSPFGTKPIPHSTMKPLIPFDVAVLKKFTAECIAAQVGYGWGDKIKHGAVPGVGFTETDCSGFVDEAVWRASGGELDLPAGSWAEEEAIKAAGFEPCSVSDGNLLDGAVRIAFYPGVGKAPVRHVVLIVNDKTSESHGSVGVDSRPWGNQGWMLASRLYVLARPTETPTPLPKPQPSKVLGHDVPGLLIDDAAYLGLKALQTAGVLTVLSLAPGVAKVHEPQHGTSVLPLEVVAGVGYVPARPLASLLDALLSWDNAAKRVTIG